MKLDFGDLYKFIASLGAAIVGATALLVWLFLKEPFGWFERSGKFTNNAQLIYEKKEQLILRIANSFETIVFIGLALGISLFLLGIIFWYIAQKRRDESEKADLNIKKRTLTDITEERKEESIKNEFITNEINDSEKTFTNEHIEVDKEKATSLEDDRKAKLAKVKDRIKKYIDVENRVYNELDRAFASQGEVLRNKMLGKAEYDVIVRKEPVDLIFEVKYYDSNRSIIAWTVNAISQVALNQQIYTIETKRHAISIIIIVIEQEVYKSINVSSINNSIQKFAQDNVKLVILPSTELNNLVDIYIKERISL